jgi:hypothetical protein
LSDEPAVRTRTTRDSEVVVHYAKSGRVVRVDVAARTPNTKEYKPDELFMSLTNASERLGVSAATLRRAAGKGTLRTRRVGNEWITTPAWLDEYAKNRRPAGRPRKTA